MTPVITGGQHQALFFPSALIFCVHVAGILVSHWLFLLEAQLLFKNKILEGCS